MGEDAHDPAFEALIQYLKTERGFDFSGYKRPSLMRRVRRQMQVVGVGSFEEYQDYLQVHPEEFTALFNMILINVTGFFRDPDAWHQLRASVLPALLQERPSGLLRVWSAGCASGEEAFSLAMVMAEVMGADHFRDRVKIYGTDVDEEALAEARHATYTPRQLASVPDDLLQTYFEPVNGGDRLAFRKDLRRCVIFGRNDLVQDAPISRIDLLACRNTLMYFNSEQQARIVQRLHFALNPSGVLFIGKAETLWSHSSLFQATDLKRRFFRKVPAEVFRDRSEFGPNLGITGRTLSESTRLRDEALLNSPVAHVVVDRHGFLATANHRADALFGVGPRDIGRPFQDLELSYRPLELRSHIEQVLAERRPRVLRDVEWVRGSGDPVYLEVQVIPLLDGSSDGGYGVSLFFTDVTAYRRLQVELEFANRQLETAYEELHSTNEELETTNEELQSTVEELETTNEELQSTNEELETMNEELQSTNEELETMNDELRMRSTELNQVNFFFETVLFSLQMGVVVADRELRVQVWNRESENLWGLRSSEVVGKHLLNLDIGLPVGELAAPTRACLSGASAREELTLDAVNRRGRAISCAVTVLPLADGDEIGGVVILTDCTSDQG
jgi:two-component system CheB/CheR fusion protein